MVLANYLTQNFLAPLKERQREQGREQGRKQGRQSEWDRIRARLLEQGLDLDELLPPSETNQDQ